LSQVNGDVEVEDRNGRVAVEPAGNFTVDVTTSKGDVELTLPPSASATVDGRTRNGDIVSDFGLTISGDQSKTVSGKIGSGGPKISLSTENGDLRIKKGSAIPAAPAPADQAAPKAPGAPNAPHLKTPKTPPPQAVTQ
jgi:DUF4097 and DUF4098 domain-containing protein YvlB